LFRDAAGNSGAGGPLDCQSRAPSLSRYRGFVFRRGRKFPMLDRQCSIMRRHFSVMPARNGVGRPFGTFFKHASTFDKVFGVGHCGTSLRTNSPDHMALDFVPCRSPPAQIIVWRMLRLKPIGQGLAPSGEEAVTLLKRHIHACTTGRRRFAASQ